MKLIVPNPSLMDEDTSLLYFTPFSLYDTVQLERFLIDAGFRDAKSERVALTSGAPSAENVVDGFLRKHMLGKEIAAKDASLLEPLAQKMEKKIRSQFGTSDLTFDLLAFLTTGVK